MTARLGRRLADCGKYPNFTLHAEKIDLEVLSAYKLPMILDFGSDDCIPCKEMAPVLENHEC